MRKYLQKYKKAIIIYFVFGVIIIPLFIHILFKIDAPLPFLVAEWEAGDVLAFYGVLIGALATIAGVYLSNVAAQENYRKDVVNRSLPFMAVTARKVKTVDLDNDGDAPDVNLKNNDTPAAFEEYDVERLYFVIEKGVVRICEFLTNEQMQFVQTGGHGRDELFPGGYSYYSVRSIYTPLEIENVGNDAATVFSVGINNTKLSKKERIFSIARTLKVGQKFYIAIYSENIDKSNCGEYDMCISYYDILGNGYEQNYTLKIWEDEKKGHYIMSYDERNTTACGKELKLPPGPGHISGSIPAADRHGSSCKFSQNSVGGDTQRAGTIGTQRTKSLLPSQFCLSAALSFCEMVHKTSPKNVTKWTRISLFSADRVLLFYSFS